MMLRVESFPVVCVCVDRFQARQRLGGEAAGMFGELLIPDPRVRRFYTEPLRKQ